MYVAESGGAGKPTVLLLHALGLDHGMWHLQPAALTGDARLLMPDLPGFGRSRFETSGLDRSVDACAGRLRLLPARAVVVGISYGGYVAATLAARHPELVSGLAISGVRLRVPRVLAALQAATFRMLPPLNRGRAVERRHLIEASKELGRVDLRPLLPRIVAPTVVFAPTRDRFVRGDVASVAAAIPNARLIAIPDGGHLWQDQAPDMLSRVIRSLLPGSSTASVER